MDTKNVIIRLVPKREHQPTDLSVTPAPRSPHQAEPPKTSPYTSPVVQLIVGSEQKAYYVPRDLLHKTQLIPDPHSSEKIYLPDVDEDTGHVLVHYLYTGTYQTLGGSVTLRSEELRTEFKRAVMANVAATSYEVHGLERLSRKTVESLGSEMNIVDIVEAIKEDFSRIPSDSAWFHAYFNYEAYIAFDLFREAKVLSDSTQTTYEAIDHERTLSAMHSFLDRIDNIALLRALTKSLWEAHQSAFEYVMETTKNINSSREEDTKSDSSPIEEAPEEECVVAGEPIIEPHIEKEPIKEAPMQEAIEDRIVVMKPRTQSKEREDDSLDPVAFNVKAKKSKKMSAMENDSLSYSCHRTINTTELVDIPAPVDVGKDQDCSTADCGAPSEKKKRKSRKGPIPDALPHPPLESLANGPSSKHESTHKDEKQELWRDHAFTKLKINGNDPQDIPRASTSNIKMDPGNNQSEQWSLEPMVIGSKKKKKSKKTKTSERDSEPVIEATINVHVPVEELGSAEVFYEKSGDRTLTEDQIVSEETESVHKPANADVIEEMAPIPIEKPQEDDLWGILSPSIQKKKKKAKKLLRSNEATVTIESETVELSGPVSEFPTTGTITMDREHIAPIDQVGINNSNTNAYPEGGSVQHVEIQDGVCPMFNEHFQQGDQWKTCERCLGYVVKQVRRSYPNGIEVL